MVAGSTSSEIKRLQSPSYFSSYPLAVNVGVPLSTSSTSMVNAAVVSGLISADKVISAESESSAVPVGVAASPITV